MYDKNDNSKKKKEKWQKYQNIAIGRKTKQKLMKCKDNSLLNE